MDYLRRRAAIKCAEKGGGTERSLRMKHENQDTTMHVGSMGKHGYFPLFEDR